MEWLIHANPTLTGMPLLTSSSGFLFRSLWLTILSDRFLKFDNPHHNPVSFIFVCAFVRDFTCNLVHCFCFNF